MPALYFNNGGVTCCTPLRTYQPAGSHYLGVSVSGTPYYLQLSASSTHPMKVNIGGTQYAPIVYPTNTDILITPTFICKRRASTEALCFYSNGNLILNTAGTACCAISIPDDDVITICGPYSGCYNNWTLNDGYLALNFTEQNACFYINATTQVTSGCGFTYHSEVDGDGYNYVCSVDGGPAASGHNIYTIIYALCFTTTHTYSGSVTTKANNGDNVYTTCATTFSGTLNPNCFDNVNICFPAMTNMCMHDNNCAYASYIGLELNGCCFINSTSCPAMYCCGFEGSPAGAVLYPAGIFWWSGSGAGIHCLTFKDYSFTRVEV